MACITPAARHSFEQLFSAAVRSQLPLLASDDVTVLPAAAPREKAEKGEKPEKPRTMVLLTSASLRFKLVAVFHVVDEALARAYFSGTEGAADWLEVLFERGNLACGAMNRDLLLYIPHVGLSTPSMLVGSAATVLASLQAEHTSHFAIHVDGKHLLDAALCMRGHATVDFVADTKVASVETGELELL